MKTQPCNFFNITILLLVSTIHQQNLVKSLYQVWSSHRLIANLRKNIKVEDSGLRKDARDKFVADVNQVSLNSSDPYEFGSFCEKVLEVNEAYSKAIKKVKRMFNKLDCNGEYSLISKR